jgi:uncharacterized protein YqeY
MTIEEQLKADMKDAMRARQSERLTCIRMLRSKLQEKAVELRSSKGNKDAGLSDEHAIQVIGTYAKQRRDSIEAYRKGGRDDLADHEQAELGIVTAYLPQQLSDDELLEIVTQAVADTGASSPKDMGAVMKAVMPKVKGRADGKRISKAAGALLSKA